MLPHAIVLLLPLLASQVQAPGLLQEQEKLKGAWKVTSLIDDGEPVSRKMLMESMASNADVTFGLETIVLLSPITNQKRTLLYKLDPGAFPKHIDVTNQDGKVSKGIYRIDGDVLLICLGDAEAPARPTEFSSEAGTNTLLFILTAARTHPETVATTPGTPVVAAKTPAAAKAPNTDQTLRTQLIGTWGHQNKDEIVYFTFNPDGTFSTLHEPKKGFKKLFDDKTRSSGVWRVEGGTLIANVTASTDSEKRGQVRSVKISTISATDVVCIDEQGQAHREWKVR